MSKVLQNKNEIDMTSGNLCKKIFLFSVPMMFTGILQLLYNAADLIVCGKFGSEHSVAAISATNALINLIINLFLGLSIGANVLMARCFGSNNKEKGDRVIHTAMLFSIIVGIVIGAFGFCFCGFFLKLMNTPSDVIDLSTTYLRIYFLGLPFSMIYNFGSSIMRATGDTKRPFYFLTFAGIFNVLLNLLLVIVFHLDVAGVAVATITAQGISAFLVVFFMVRNKGFYRLNLRKLKLHKKEAIEIAMIGLPAGIQGSIFSLSNVLIQSSVNSLGTTVMDGNGAACSLEGFVYVCMNSVAQACVAFVSANFGAKRIENIRKSIFSSVFIVLAVGLGVGLFVLLLGENLLGLYLKDSTAISEGYKRLLIICPTYFLCGLMDTFAYSLRGIGYSLLPAIVSLAGACGLRILWIYTVFPIEYFNSLRWLVASYPISWLITSSVHVLFLTHLYKKVKIKLNSEAVLNTNTDNLEIA